MKPAAFSYLCPSTLEEAMDLLTEYGDEGKIIAGGQSFVPILNMRMSEPEYLIDIHLLKELEGIRLEDNVIKIGALTTQRNLEENVLIKEKFPVLEQAVKFIGHVQTRNRGTVGGSVAHADPSAELPLSFLALNAEIIVQSASATRTADINEFFLTYLTTDMMPDEILTEIRVPIQQPKGYAFEEFSRRHGDFALVSVVCLLSTDDDAKIDSVRLVLGGIDAVPVLAEEAMDLLIGKEPTEKVLEEAAELAIENADPDEDLHASIDYRLHLAKTLTKKAIQKAYNMERGGRNNG
ncbi:molybdopterin dehydrogenase [Oceanobacillus oncorhynchi subsp. incaldanensis]|uniref:FAD binding domain-containing protein n=1 Tax=Oceanobacillus oncorhynchi TaxID=545501 RepID=UPI001B0CC148|nr:xanthine dehydrogenase family protein subunit M [Oceanobacillus oncorhynchi]GIO19554.1 molybdopterin dehydrogenase [Oceanobacillus oncorhynchi subsp. incaldanensis]